MYISCVCTHICIYMYIYTYICIYLHTYTCIHTHTHLHTHTDIGKKYLGCPSGTVARSISSKEARHDDKRLYNGRCSYGYLATFPRLKCVQRAGEIRINAPFMSICIYIYICVCVDIYLCMYVYMYVCMYVYL